MIKFVSDLQKVDGFLWVLRFPPLITLTAKISLNIVESGVKPISINIYTYVIKFVKLHHWCSGWSARLRCGRLWFKTQSGQTKDYNIGIYGLSANLSRWLSGEKAKTDWFGIRIMCLSAATCLSMDSCFNPKRFSPIHYHLIKYNLFQP